MCMYLVQKFSDCEDSLEIRASSHSITVLALTNNFQFHLMLSESWRTFFEARLQNRGILFIADEVCFDRYLLIEKFDAGREFRG